MVTPFFLSCFLGFEALLISYMPILAYISRPGWQISQSRLGSPENYENPIFLWKSMELIHTFPDFSSGSRLTSEPTGVAEINRNYFSGNSCTYTPLARPNATLALLEVPKRF